METSYLYEISLFYGWWQFSVCLFAFCALMAIWYHIGRKQQDLGQVWLALSILSWAFSGLGEILFLTEEDSVFRYKEGWRSVFSLLNSLFILLALPWFRYLPGTMAPLIKSRFWPVVIGIPFVFALLPTLYKTFLVRDLAAIEELDVYYALLTLIFLGFVFWESFKKRRLPLLAWLSIITVLVTLVAQVYKLLDDKVNLLLFSAIFKTSLIMLFFALALSWVKELTETVLLKSDQLKLTFSRKLKTAGRTPLEIVIQGLPGGSAKTVQLTPALYGLFKTFAQRKVSTPEGWLEIKPKNFEASKTYDVNDHNELKRLVSALSDGIFGKGNWSKQKHFIPLKTALFEMSENRERKIRLALPKKNITFENQ